ncbi:MAG: TonB-dependent receptor [Flammeovirgaceae bacterium]|jgi:outer membrane receptor protein involved in Fe transport|nr:TonB-dependent receptor [Flammeovirgaceae bacterium]
MTKFYKRLLLPIALILLAATASWAQTTISGTVKDGTTGEKLAGVNIVVKGRVLGTISNANGEFTIKVNDNPPLTLSFSFIGFKSQELTISNANTTGLEIVMEEQTLLGQEIVISASRVEESILKSPVTVEKVDLIAIQQTSAPEYFDALANVKGVQVTSSSLNFPAVNTRGFATIANERFVQWIDGIDGSAPILNFPTGNIVGIGELDAEGLELIPGAASALYGPNAFNGILIMTSKSPFDYQGLSAQLKTGITTSDAQGQAFPYNNFGVRYAKAFNNKFAFKVNFSFMDAEDWAANDYKQDRLRANSEFDLSTTEANFDGVNTYGDEARISPPGFALDIRRTGFREEDIIDDYSARSIKGDVALHYRINDKIEALYNYRYGSGDAIYQGDAKYALRGFTQVFQKLELRADNFFVRGYVTQTDAGDSYNLLALGSFMNEALSPTAAQWAPNYIAAYLGTVPGVDPGNDAQARQWADVGFHNRPGGQPRFARPQPGTLAFRQLTDSVRTALFQGNPPGATFRDDSRIWHGEFNYNFKNQINFMELMVGGNVRQYDLFTDGTILNEDPDAPSRAEVNFQRIKINEFGGYIQAAKTFGSLKLTASARYDKNENFDGQFTPRVSAVYTVNDNHNFRASFQTGFRNPQTQAQFIYFPASDATLLGSTEANAARYGVHNGGSWTRDSYLAWRNSGGTVNADGTITGGNQQLLVTTNVPYVQPEQLKAFEVGYKGLFENKILVDLNGYYNIYNDFIGTDFVASKAPATHQGTNLNTGTIFSLYSNAPNEITSYGVGLGVTYNLPKGYTINANYNYADFEEEQIEGRVFNAGFNTPNNKFNIGVGNRKLTKNLGFNLNYRWQEGFNWFSSFGTWDVPEFGVFDASFSYRVPSIKSVVKAGGTNLFGGDYRTNLGGPFVGQMYYISITFDEFFK